MEWDGLIEVAKILSAAAGAYAAVRVEIRLIWREMDAINNFIGRNRHK